MQSSDILDFAYKLYSENDTEVAYRTSIGRSYYSVFHPAQDEYKRLNLSGVGNTHTKVINGFLNKHQAIGRAMDVIFSDRVRADYHLNQTVSASEARASLSKAKKIQEKLAEL